MIEGLCRVCGGVLTSPLVRCPGCATPHHKDCWDYNGGCAIYGCTQLSTSLALVATEIQAPEDTQTVIAIRRWHVVTLSLAGLMTIWILSGLPPALGFFVACAGIFYVLGPSAPETVGDAAGLLHYDAARGLGLEMKSVRSLLGAGAPHELAHAYALFEQRHRRQAFEPEEQQALARELVENGYWALGLEALDKAILQPSARGDTELLSLRRRTLLEDPAYLVEGLTGPPELVERIGNVLDCHACDLTEAFGPDAGAAWAPSGQEPTYLVSLGSSGWGMLFPHHVRIPSDPHAGPLSLGILMAGPLPGEEAVEMARERWEAHRPTLSLAAREITLPAAIERVEEIYLSHKSARFVTGAGERTLAWADVHSVVYGQLEVVERRPVLRRDHYGPRARYSYVEEEMVQYEPILEVHCGSGPLRLRIDRPRPGLYRYLGRRREYSHAANLILVAKDIVRFGHRTRVGHGLLNLLNERSGPWSRFSDLHRLEEYLLWFWVLGMPATREAWSKVRDRVGRPTGILADIAPAPS